MKKNIKVLFVVILSNLIVFFSIVENKKDNNNIKLRLKNNLESINLSVKTLFHFSLDELKKGIRVNIYNGSGELILNDVWVYSNNLINDTEPTKVIIQVAKSNLQKVVHLLGVDGNYFILPFSSLITKRISNEAPKELLL